MKSFTLIYGISNDKIYSIAQKENNPPVPVYTEKLSEKKDSIKAFLGGIWADDSMSEFDPVNPNIRRISSLHSKKQLWMIFCQTAEVNEAQLASQSYFLKIWNKHFPYLSINFYIFVYNSTYLLNYYKQLMTTSSSVILALNIKRTLKSAKILEGKDKNYWI